MVQTGPWCVRRHGALQGMVTVETIARLRRLHFVKGIKRICRETGLARETVRGIVRAGLDGPTERRYARKDQPVGGTAQPLRGQR